MKKAIKQIGQSRVEFYCKHWIAVNTIFFSHVTLKKMFIFLHCNTQVQRVHSIENLKFLFNPDTDPNIHFIDLSKKNPHIAKKNLTKEKDFKEAYDFRPTSTGAPFSTLAKGRTLTVYLSFRRDLQVNSKRRRRRQ